MLEQSLFNSENNTDGGGVFRTTREFLPNALGRCQDDLTHHFVAPGERKDGLPAIITYKPFRGIVLHASSVVFEWLVEGS